MRRFGVAITAALLLASACGGSDGSNSGARPSTDATVKIVAPAAGTTIDGKSFNVEIDLDGGRIVKETSKDLNSRDGHLHVAIDGAVLTQTYGLKQKIETPKPGRHILSAEFVAKDHSPFDPRVVDSIPIEVPK